MSHIEEALAVLRQHLGPAGLMGASHVAPALTVEQARALVEALSAPSEAPGPLAERCGRRLDSVVVTLSKDEPLSLEHRRRLAHEIAIVRGDLVPFDVVHRDLKPSNVLVVTTPSPRASPEDVSPAMVTRSCSMNRAEAEFLKDWASGRSLFGGNWARLTEALRRAIELTAMDRSKVYEVRLLVGAAPECDEDEDSGCDECGSAPGDACDPSCVTRPIEDVDAELKRRGIDTGPAFEKVREALRRRAAPEQKEGKA